MPLQPKGKAGSPAWRRTRERIAAQQWRELFPGVVWTPSEGPTGPVSGEASPTREELFAAALMWAGDSAALSSASAALLHQLDGEWASAPIRLIVPRTQALFAEGAVVARASLEPVDVTEVDGLRCTTVSRTLVDLAAQLDELELAIAFESAWRLSPFVREELEAHLKAAPKRRGARGLRKLLRDSKRRRRAFMSALEVRMWRFLAEQRFPMPIPQYGVRDGRGEMFIDFAYPKRMLALETDGKADHEGRFYKDRTRWQRLEALGWSTIKITTADLQDPDFAKRLTEIFKNNPLRRARPRGRSKEHPPR